MAPSSDSGAVDRTGDFTLSRRPRKALWLDPIPKQESQLVAKAKERQLLKYADLANGLMQPVSLGKGEGRPVPSNGEKIRVKLEGKRGELPFDVIEATVPPGQGTPAHVHSEEDESFYVLEGTFAFLVGDKVITAGQGSYLFGPRNVPHG